MLIPLDASNDLVGAIEAVDGPWPLVGLMVIGLYAIIWRFGDKILKVLEVNRSLAASANEKAEHVANSIITNHGSKNIGDAVDRLTSRFDEHIDETRTARVEFDSVKHELTNHVARTDATMGKVIQMYAELSDRIDAMDTKE